MWMMGRWNNGVDGLAETTIEWKRLDDGGGGL